MFILLLCLLFQTSSAGGELPDTAAAPDVAAVAPADDLQSENEKLKMELELAQLEAEHAADADNKSISPVATHTGAGIIGFLTALISRLLFGKKKE